VVTTLGGFADREPDEALGVGIELAGGLLDGWEALVETREGLVAELIDARDIRAYILVRLGDVREDVGRKGLVG
jgi:hypothetical protein